MKPIGTTIPVSKTKRTSKKHPVVARNSRRSGSISTNLRVRKRTPPAFAGVQPVFIARGSSSCEGLNSRRGRDRLCSLWINPGIVVVFGGRSPEATRPACADEFFRAIKIPTPPTVSNPIGRIRRR